MLIYPKILVPHSYQEMTVFFKTKVLKLPHNSGKQLLTYLSSLLPPSLPLSLLSFVSLTSTLCQFTKALMEREKKKATAEWAEIKARGKLGPSKTLP